MTTLLHETRIEDLQVSIYRTNEEVGKAAADEASDIIRQAIRERGEANVIFATGNSQLTFLRALREMDVDWPRVNVFHMDEFADFDDPVWVKVVKLDERSRRQQVGEGHFASLDEVPTDAITLTIPALLAAKQVLAIVPEARKAEAVFRALKGPITPDCPASILRRTPHAHLFLDADSAAKVIPSLGH